MPTRLLSFIFACLFVSSIFAALPPVKRTERQPMTLSLAVPCCGRHFVYLNDLLQLYAKQTQLPDEVVISLSNIEIIPPQELQSLEQSSWPFTLKIAKTEGRISAGDNRNRAADQCTSDLILYQDADDIPHPQRIECVKWVFENYHVDHLLHLFFDSTDNGRFIPCKPEEMELIHASSFGQIYDIGRTLEGFRSRLHNGNICTTREWATMYKWPTFFDFGEDMQYNISAYDHQARTVIIGMPLIWYRQEFSCFSNN